MWNPLSLVDYATVIIYAKRRSGKSVAVQDIVYHNRKRFDDVYLFSNTIELQKDSVYGFVPKENKYNDLKPDVIQKIMDNQQNLIMSKNKTGKGEIPHICIILDDILSSAVFQNRSNNIIKTLFVNGRHYHITLFVLTQSFSGNEGVPPVYRKNADHIMAFFLHSEIDRESIAKQYLSLSSSREGMELFKNITSEPYQMIVIDNYKAGARQYSDYVSAYKANPARNFVLPRRRQSKIVAPSSLRDQQAPLLARSARLGGLRIPVSTTSEE